MIKKIPVDLLKPGMYVSDFNAGWLNHPFVLNSMRINSDAEVEQVLAAGIRELYIDTSRGLDVGDGVPTRSEATEEVRRSLEQAAQRMAAAGDGSKVSLAEEMGRARAAYGEAIRVVRTLMEDVRLGKQVEIAQVQPTVEKITASVLRNSSAMLTMRRLAALGDQTFEHSVGVCTILTAFAKSSEVTSDSIHDIALGGLIHDVGKMRVAAAVLNKPARLTEEEYVHMKSHVVLGLDFIRQQPGVPALALEPLALHHERIDGSGYPKGLKGSEISRIGQMAGIVDVYDALTSERYYRPAISPAAAVQKLFEWSKFLFDAELVQQFLGSVGIYPVGTLVRLESGRLGVVVEQNEKQLLTPVVKVMFDARHGHYVAPQRLDLGRPLGSGGADRIVGFEMPDKWGIDVARFLA